MTFISLPPGSYWQFKRSGERHKTVEWAGGLPVSPRFGIKRVTQRVLSQIVVLDRRVLEA